MTTDYPAPARRNFLLIVGVATFGIGFGIPRGLADEWPLSPQPARAMPARMPNGEIRVGLDIGPSKVIALVVEMLPEGKTRILGVGEAPTLGIRDGEVVDSKAATQCIRAALVDAEQKADVIIKSVHLAAFGGDDQGVTLCIQCVNEVGVDVEDVTLRPLASTEAVLSVEDKKRGALAIDMGAGTTSYIVFPNAHAHHSRPS